MTSDWELGRLLFLHIYKWCIGNFLPSQHRGLCVWLHSCNALDRSRSSSTVATRAAVHKDANCTNAAAAATYFGCNALENTTSVQRRYQYSAKCAQCTQELCNSAVQCKSASMCLGAVCWHTHWINSSIDQK